MQKRTPIIFQFLLILLLTITSSATVSAQESRRAKEPAPATWRSFALDCMDACWLGGERRTYGLHFDDDLSTNRPPQRLVVVVHGFHSDRWHVSQLSACVRKSGVMHAVFEYPNDQAVSESAELLSGELKRLRRSAPACKVSLVTHSMGGLVAREALENPQLDPGNVTRMIMIAPPNHGSQLADCNCSFVDMWEYWHSGEQRKKAGLIYGSIEDGLGEAAEDLKPSSTFLSTLNGRKRNAKVKYSILLGNRAPIKSDDARHATSETGNCRWTMTWLASSWYDDLDEVVNGRGDGVVSLASGQLKGVRDVAVFRFDHIDVLGEPSTGVVDLVHMAILARLR